MYELNFQLMNQVFIRVMFLRVSSSLCHLVGRHLPLQVYIDLESKPDVHFIAVKLIYIDYFGF